MHVSPFFTSFLCPLRALKLICIALFGMGLVSLSSASAYADEGVVADSNIVAATVYSNRATVTRRATVQLEKGAQNVVFKELPVILFPDSLRAKGQARGSVTLGAVSHKRVNSNDLIKPREKELNDQIVKIQDKTRILNTEKQLLDKKTGFLEKLGNTASLRENEEIAKLSLNTDQWASAADTIFKGVRDAELKKVAYDIEIRDLNKEMQRLRNELNQIRTGQKSSFDVTIPVEADSATELVVELSYQVPNATWKPIYDARLQTDGESELQIVQYGAVRQNTGEDWSDIDLRLSTAQPHRGSSLPDLQPYWVNIWDQSNRSPAAVSGFARKSSRAESSLAMSADMAMEEVGGNFAGAPQAMREATFQTAQIETGGFVSEYKIPGPSRVASDGTETKLLVGAFETDSSLQIHVRPQLSTEAFVVTEAKLKGEAPILPGQVNLFRDGAYIGQSFFPMLRPGENHNLFFGVDDQVTVKRNVVKDEKKDSGIISRDNTMERHFVTEIQNLHKDTVTLVVQETVPVGQNEKIEVKILDDETTQGYKNDIDDKKGLLEWRTDLSSKQSQKINLGWKISWPKDHMINGLR